MSHLACQLLIVLTCLLIQLLTGMKYLTGPCQPNYFSGDRHVETKLAWSQKEHVILLFQTLTKQHVNYRPEDLLNTNQSTKTVTDKCIWHSIQSFFLVNEIK